jgi:hypothetical protein
MALIKGKQIQDTSVSLAKLLDAGSVTLSTGTITLSTAARLQISADPTQDNDVVRKAYVDSVATGLDVKKSVAAIYNEAHPNPTSNSSNGSTLTVSILNAAISAASPLPALILDGYTVADGDRVLLAINTVSRAKYSGIYTYKAGSGAGAGLVRATDADNLNGNSEVTGGLFTFVEQGTTYGDTGWVLTTPNGIITLAGTGNAWTGDDVIFTQFSYAGVVEAGVGLSRSGTVLDVNYDNSSIGINGSDQLYIKASGVANSMLVNATHTFAGDSGTGAIALGGTLNIVGHPNGIDTVMSGSTLTITLDLSEVTTVTTIADTDFIVSSKSSDSTNQKITFANLKSLIGATSQLGISVEGGSAASFDLDTDTLDFSTGDGVTFTKSASTAGTTDTLTVTLALNTISEDMFTSNTAAANASLNLTLVANTTQILHVDINGVNLKRTQFSVSGTTVTISGVPYAIESSDEITVRYIVR